MRKRTRKNLARALSINVEDENSKLSQRLRLRRKKKWEKLRMIRTYRQSSRLTEGPSKPQ